VVSFRYFGPALLCARFFKVIPISGFFLVFGYFAIRWHKYLGHR